MHYYINDSAPTYFYTLSLHDALPIFLLSQWNGGKNFAGFGGVGGDLRLQFIETGEFLLRPDEIDKRHRSEEHTSELQSRFDLVCRLLLEKKKNSRLCCHENIKLEARQ